MSSNIVKNGNGTVTVTFQEPIRADIRKGDETGEEVFRDVTFRPMSMGDIKALGNAEIEDDNARTYWLMQRLCKMPEAAFDKISGEDLKSCMTAVKGFLPQSRKTSANAQ